GRPPPALPPREEGGQAVNRAPQRSRQAPLPRPAHGFPHHERAGARLERHHPRNRCVPIVQRDRLAPPYPAEILAQSRFELRDANTVRRRAFVSSIIVIVYEWCR